MIRTKLIWFAAGAAVSAASALLGTLLKSEPAVETAFLVIEEPTPAAESAKIADEDMIANRAGEMLRECGAPVFETTFLYEDHSPTAEMPITRQNERAFACALREGGRRSYRMDIQLRTGKPDK